MAAPLNFPINLNYPQVDEEQLIMDQYIHSFPTPTIKNFKPDLSLHEDLYPTTQEFVEYCENNNIPITYSNLSDKRYELYYLGLLKNCVPDFLRINNVLNNQEMFIRVYLVLKYILTSEKARGIKIVNGVQKPIDRDVWMRFYMYDRNASEWCKFPLLVENFFQEEVINDEISFEHLKIMKSQCEKIVEELNIELFSRPINVLPCVSLGHTVLMPTKCIKFGNYTLVQNIDNWNDYVKKRYNEDFNNEIKFQNHWLKEIFKYDEFAGIKTVFGEEKGQEIEEVLNGLAIKRFRSVKVALPSC